MISCGNDLENVIDFTSENPSLVVPYNRDPWIIRVYYTDRIMAQENFNWIENYYLPINFSGFSFALNLHAQRALGYPPTPGTDDGESTDFLYLGLLINTPLQF